MVGNSQAGRAQQDLYIATSLRTVIELRKGRIGWINNRQDGAGLGEALYTNPNLYSRKAMSRYGDVSIELLRIIEKTCHLDHWEVVGFFKLQKKPKIRLFWDTGNS